MLSIKTIFVALDRRFRRAKPGSVLIIVIVLLLLLAILGAAYISTTRSARVASAQNVLNSDVDTMLSGISKICEGVIVDDLNDTFGDLHGNTAYSGNTGATAILNRSFYQGEAHTAPPGTTGPPVAPNVPSYIQGDIGSNALSPTFHYIPQGNSAALGAIVDTPTGWQPLNGHLPVIAAGSDPWLAIRIPTQNTAGNPIWQSISQSVQVNSSGVLYPASILATPFEDPTAGVISLWANTPLVGPMTPKFVGMPIGASTPSYYVPALTDGTYTHVAGDADGDGIADSLFFRIPGASLDGLTWFAAVRIIDNNSAINANTAWSRDQDYVYTSYASGGGTATATNNIWNLFQTSVGLQELINTNDIYNYSSSGSGGTPSGTINPTINLNQRPSSGASALPGLNAYRFNQINSATPTAGYNPFDETAINSNTPPQAFDRGSPPVSSGATNNTNDCNFISEGEAFYQQFVRRVANPGYNTYSSSQRYQPMPFSDEAALAYHFCLVNPEATLSGTPSSLIENFLPFSLSYWQAPSGGNPAKYYQYIPYGSNPSTDVATWFNDNFNYAFAPLDYSATPGAQPIRPLLVSRNPVSNYIQQVYNNNSGATPSYPNIYAGLTSIYDPILPSYMLPYMGAPATVNEGHYKGAWSSGTTYQLNDIVVGTDNLTYIYVYAVSSGNTPTAPSRANLTTTVTVSGTSYPFTAFWQLQPWSANPVKANVNTATFRELFRAFWSVMAGNPSNATPFGYLTTDDPNGIYDGTYTNPQFEFRSPLRDPTASVAPNATQLDPPASAAINNGGKGATNTNAMLLRAAIAAANTLGLRDNSQNIVSKTIILKNAWVAPSAGVTPVPTDVEARVYSNAPQPFISEVYVNTNAGTDPSGTSSTLNKGGYVAVVLFNPYPVPLTLANWTLAYINRQITANSGTYPKLQLTTIGTIAPPGTTPVVIQPSGYLLIENCNYTNPGAPTTQPDSNAAAYRPVDSGILPTLGSTAPSGTWTGPAIPPSPATQPSTMGGTMYADVYMPFLETVIQGATVVAPGQTTPSIGGELVLLRPRRADGTLTQYTDPANPNAAGSESFDEVNNTADLVPVDSYDFTNLQQQPTGGSYAVWHYVRAAGNDANGNYRFKTTYPGGYNGFAAGPRETGTYSQIVANAKSPVFDPTTSAAGYSSTRPSPSTQPSPGTTTWGNFPNDFPPVQVYNVANVGSGYSSHFPNPVVVPDVANGVIPVTPPNPPYNAAPTPFYHPLGGFSRNGDMLDIPFIGAYRIRVVGATDITLPYGPTAFLEMNSLPMDCSLAAVETSIPAEDLAQNIGRFVPMAASASYVTQLQAGTTNLPDYYAWARNLFNYLTVQSSTDAYLPNFDPNLSTSVYANATSTPVRLPTFAYPPQNTSQIPPTPTLTVDATAPDQTHQDNVGTEGLVNINTASWKVLSMLPFVPSTTSGSASINQQIAQKIVLYRDGDGTSANPPHAPFMSIFDLNQVPGFQNGNPGSPSSPPPAPSSALGLLSPADLGFETSSPNPNPPLGNEEDYQADCLTLNRISNLITTRSDTFTIYIEVQGWQNAGSTNAALPPQPMITRRYAFIVDRSAINGDPNSRFLKTVTVPND
ncbi:MAG: helix-hairpin-helix domain-containing protein [Tepidisphaeraceae bacterium]|jgi:hypothetical protein